MTTKIEFDPDHEPWGYVTNGVWKNNFDMKEEKMELELKEAFFKYAKELTDAERKCEICGDDMDIDSVGYWFCWSNHSTLQVLISKIKSFLRRVK